jgi:catechol 2,3-dioxygenase-like lactoylglutathione lyase family enzyme
MIELTARRHRTGRLAPDDRVRRSMDIVPGGVRLSGAVLSSPDPRRLAEFYGRLLRLEPDQEEEHWASLRTRQGGVRLSFQHEEHYERPVWPSRDGSRQTMLHLDFDVEDLPAACDHALRTGAVLADHQPQPDVRVFLDPDGHPFCFAAQSR